MCVSSGPGRRSRITFSEKKYRVRVSCPCHCEAPVSFIIVRERYFAIIPLFSPTIPFLRRSNDVQNDRCLLLAKAFHTLQVHAEEGDQYLSQSDLKWDNSAMKLLFGLPLNRTTIPVWFDQNFVDQESEKEGLCVDVSARVFREI